MTAQQQLAELNDAVLAYFGQGADQWEFIKVSRMAFELIRDHGPAIAELIALAEESARYMVNPIKRPGFMSALTKLTEPK